METANALLALAGDIRNTVPKTITPAEFLLLEAIHGQGAVRDMVVSGETDRTNSQEIERLRGFYKARDDENRPIVDQVFTGARPRLPKTFEELEIPEESYKATARAKPGAKTSESTDASGDGASGGDAATTAEPAKKAPAKKGSVLD